MKIISKYTAVIVVLFLSNVMLAQMSKIEIRAIGLTCSMCSNAINKQLKTIADVVAVDTDLNMSTFMVTVIAENQLNPAIFKDKVEKAGFFIGSFVFSTTLSNLKNEQYIALENKSDKSEVVQVKILDKGYVSEKEFKRISKSYKDVLTLSKTNDADFHYKTLN